MYSGLPFKRSFPIVISPPQGIWQFESRLLCRMPWLPMLQVPKYSPVSYRVVWLMCLRGIMCVFVPLLSGLFRVLGHLHTLNFSDRDCDSGSPYWMDDGRWVFFQCEVCRCEVPQIFAGNIFLTYDVLNWFFPSANAQYPLVPSQFVWAMALVAICTIDIKPIRFQTFKGI